MLAVASIDDDEKLNSVCGGAPVRQRRR